MKVNFKSNIIAIMIFSGSLITVIILSLVIVANSGNRSNGFEDQEIISLNNTNISDDVIPNEGRTLNNSTRPLQTTQKAPNIPIPGGIRNRPVIEGSVAGDNSVTPENQKLDEQTASRIQNDNNSQSTGNYQDSNNKTPQLETRIEGHRDMDISGISSERDVENIGGKKEGNGFEENSFRSGYPIDNNLRNVRSRGGRLNPPIEYPYSDPGKMDARLYQMGKNYYKYGYLNDAIKIFIKLSVEYPRSKYWVNSQIILGKTLIERGIHDKNTRDFIEAEKIFRAVYSTIKSNKLVAHLKDLSEFIIAMAEANRQFGRPSIEIEQRIQNFITEYDGSLGRDDKDDLYTQLGYLKFFENKYEDAQRIFQNADTELSKLGRASVYIKSKPQAFDKAINIYEDFLKYNQKSSYYDVVKKAFLIHTFYYAKQFFDNDYFRNAYFYFKKIIDMPDLFKDENEYEDSLYHIGQSFFKEKKYTESIKYFDLALNNSNKTRDDDSLLFKATAYFEKGDYQFAANLFQKHLDYFKNSHNTEVAKKFREQAENLNVDESERKMKKETEEVEEFLKPN